MNTIRKTNKLIKLGFRVLFLDYEIIEDIINEELFQELNCFSKLGKIYVLGSNKPELKIPFDFDYINLPSEIRRSSYDLISVLRDKKRRDSHLNKIFKHFKPELRSRILYVKKTKENVLTDIPKLYELDFETCRKKRDCDLRLVTYGMENCPHKCIYCFANYNYSQPITVLFDFDKKLKEDLKNKELKKIVDWGYPIHVGSIMDFGSRLSLFFNQIYKVLDALKGKNIFIGTKSPLIAQEDIIKAINEHGKAEIVFTYTGLSELEPNLPFNSKKFPFQEIEKLISNKVKVILLYRPIIPGMNDKYDQIKIILKKAKEAGINEISTGFLKINFRFKDSIKSQSPRFYRYFKKILTDKVETDFLPPYNYRVQIAQRLREICNELKLNISFCQPYIGDLKFKLTNSLCPCTRKD